MKRINNLYDQICDIENITLAYHKARKGKKKQPGVILFEKQASLNIESLHKELITGSYKTSQYFIFTIHDPKERLVYRLPFKDRIVHHAIMNVLEPIWTKIFITQTYSCIRGRGIHLALQHIKRDLKDVSGTAYCLKFDITKFYPSIDHLVMKNIIRRKIKDTRFLALLDEIIDSAPGLPIGNYLSQFLANLYLSYFDHWIKEEKKVSYYYRYADDIVILAENKAYLHVLFKEIDQYLSKKLKLKIKPNYQIFPTDSRGIDFIGYVFRHTHIRMRKNIKKSLCKKAALLNKKVLSEKEYLKQIAPNLGWAKHCNTKRLLNKIIPYEKIC